MDHAPVEGARRDRVYDGGVLEAYGGDGEGHDGARMKMVMPGMARRMGLLSCLQGVVIPG